jgi:hypothetical protein
VASSLGQHVAAYGYAQAKGFDGQSADNESAAFHRVGEQHKRGQSKKQSGGHHKQSGVLHGEFLSGLPNKDTCGNRKESADMPFPKSTVPRQPLTFLEKGC